MLADDKSNRNRMQSASHRRPASDRFIIIIRHGNDVRRALLWCSCALLEVINVESIGVISKQVLGWRMENSNSKYFITIKHVH